MDIRDHSKDFTEDAYQELLRLAKKNYRFATFPEFKTDERIILWRHDIDFSLHRAVRLAEIEREEDVVTTYFTHFHSPFYNLLESDISKRLKVILGMGHKLGLHFDPMYYGERIIDKDSMVDFLLREKQLLEEEFEESVEVFSFHNPDVGDWLHHIEDEIGSMINAYGETFLDNFGYCSDSNGYWWSRRLKDVLENAEDERLQVLTHPAWWQRAPLSPRQRIHRSVFGRAENVMKNYDSFLEKNNRLNLD